MLVPVLSGAAYIAHERLKIVQLHLSYISVTYRCKFVRKYNDGLDIHFNKQTSLLFRI